MRQLDGMHLLHVFTMVVRFINIKMGGALEQKTWHESIERALCEELHDDVAIACWCRQCACCDQQHGLQGMPPARCECPAGRAETCTAQQGSKAWVLACSRDRPEMRRRRLSRSSRGAMLAEPVGGGVNFCEGGLPSSGGLPAVSLLPLHCTASGAV